MLLGTDALRTRKEQSTNLVPQNCPPTTPPSVDRISLIAACMLGDLIGRSNIKICCSRIVRTNEKLWKEVVERERDKGSSIIKD